MFLRNCFYDSTWSHLIIRVAPTDNDSSSYIIVTVLIGAGTGILGFMVVPTEEIKVGSFVVVARPVALSNHSTVPDMPSVSAPDVGGVGGASLLSRPLYSVCPLAMAGKHGEGTDEMLKTGWGLGYGMGIGPGNNLRGKSEFQWDRARERKRERERRRGDGAQTAGTSASVSNQDLQRISEVTTRSRSHSGTVAHGDMQEEQEPIPIIPPTLPGWSGAALPHRSSPAFPEDTTHTYELSVCAATSRGYASTQSKVGG